MADYVVFLTERGQAKMASAMTNGKPINITTFKVSDSTAPVSSGMTNINPTEQYSDNVSSIAIDPTNTNWVIVEGIIPATIGGFYIREVGLFDDEGEMIAISKYPQSYKPDISGAVAKEVVIRLIVEVTDADCVNITIDPHLTNASVQYVLDTLASYVKWIETTINSEQDTGKVVRLVKSSESLAYAGKIHPVQIPSLTEDHIPSTHSDTTLIVSKATTGITNYFSTITEALNSLPLRINHNVDIIIMGDQLSGGYDYDEDVVISGFRGKGGLNLRSDKSDDTNFVRIKAIKVDKCTIPVRINNVSLKGSYVYDESTYALGVYNTPAFVGITGCNITNLSNQAFFGINVINSSNVVLADDTIDGYSSGLNVSTSIVTLHNSTTIERCSTGISTNDSLILGDPDTIVDPTTCTASTQILNSIFTSGTNNDSVVLWKHATHQTGSAASYLIPRLDNNGKILSSQLPSVTPNRPDAYEGITNTVRYYVDNQDGKDIDPYNGSIQLPFMTIGRALECIPAMFSGTYEICVKGSSARPQEFSKDVYLTGFTGLSPYATLNLRAIDFSSANYTNASSYGAKLQSVYISGNNLNINIIGFKLQNLSEFKGTISCVGNSGKVCVETCCFDTPNNYAAIYAQDAYVEVKNIVAAGQTYVFHAADRGVIKIATQVTTGSLTDTNGESKTGELNTDFIKIDGTGRVAGLVNNWNIVANRPSGVYADTNTLSYFPGNYGPSQFWGKIIGRGNDNNDETFLLDNAIGHFKVKTAEISDTLTFHTFKGVDVGGTATIEADSDIGLIRAKNLYNASYAGSDSDLAEYFAINDKYTLEDVNNHIVSMVDDRLVLTNLYNYRTMMGVVSTTATHILGEPIHNPDNKIFAPVGLAGVVNVLLIDDDYQLGDYVTYSDNPGKGKAIPNLYRYDNNKVIPVIGKIIKIVDKSLHLVQVIIMRT